MITLHLCSWLRPGSYELQYSNYCSNSKNDYEIFLKTTLDNWLWPSIIDKIIMIRIGSHIPASSVVKYVLFLKSGNCAYLIRDGFKTQPPAGWPVVPFQFYAVAIVLDSGNCPDRMEPPVNRQLRFKAAPYFLSNQWPFCTRMRKSCGCTIYFYNTWCLKF